jgi:hypothetical protein
MGGNSEGLCLLSDVIHIEDLPMLEVKVSASNSEIEELQIEEIIINETVRAKRKKWLASTRKHI